jgi:glycosyltransferase involved in cell wall biosynthesis
MTVSLVIPTYNRAVLLRETIPAIMGQKTDGFQFEVIFVSNGSQDNTADVLAEAAARHPNLRFFVIAPTGGPSAPRNKGIREASGEIVVIMDDDVIPDETMLLEHVRFHRQHPEPHYAAMGELYIPDRMLRDPMSLFHQFPYDEFRGWERLTWLHFWTCNVSVKRVFMLRHGMFREDFLCYEDVISGYHLAAAGMELRFLPHARGQHVHQQKPESLPAKGRNFGNWLWMLIRALPERDAMIRFGILDPRIGYPLLARRLLRRAGFRLLYNPLVLAILRLCGGASQTRSRLTDLYLFLIFRGHLLKGYAEARRADLEGKAVVLQPMGEGVGGSAPEPLPDRAPTVREGFGPSSRNRERESENP